MELRHLRYFVAVAEELNFRRAAERLRMSQPPLSLQIKQLEEEIGEELFERTRQYVKLTAAGRELYTEALLTLSSAERAMQNTRKAARGEAGELRIGFTQSGLLLEALPQAMHEFRGQFPGVDVSLVEMDSMSQINALASRELGVGLVHKPRGPILPAVTLSKLADDHLIVAVPDTDVLAGHTSVSVSHLRDRSFICTPKISGSGLYQHVTELCWSEGFAPDISQEAHTLSTIVVLVSMGLGVAILPASTRRIAVDGVTYLALETANEPAEFYVATSSLWSDFTADNFRRILLDSVAITA
ncbi:LysR substrate-binding domain-containing protein [Subtercola lobariae]|uniref:Transcriptional regulator n=1 Tax=Subtercola lobariae TaxID=1588641 RepID=A0A917AYD1_9MICO|nr:LysR substrate-binding domain-containing protein [Subtercola lobariae]GGF10236.1 transcriptional regulator [Subtercola lobariae]